jgi:hypothetical protein
MYRKEILILLEIVSWRVQIIVDQLILGQEVHHIQEPRPEKVVDYLLAITLVIILGVLQEIIPDHSWVIT